VYLKPDPVIEESGFFRLGEHSMSKGPWKRNWILADGDKPLTYYSCYSGLKRLGYLVTGHRSKSDLYAVIDQASGQLIAVDVDTVGLTRLLYDMRNKRLARAVS
jgi:hypothetical protein